MEIIDESEVRKMVRRACKEHGSLRAFAAHLGVSAAFVSDIARSNTMPITQEQHQAMVKRMDEALARSDERLEKALARIAELESTVGFLRSTLYNCAAHAGLPDPATGCRAIMATVKDALAVP